MHILQKINYGSAQDIASALNLSKPWVAEVIKELRQANKLYITDWKHTARTGDLTQVYALVESQEDVDVPKPKPLTSTQKTTLYRRRRRLAKLLKLTSQDSSQCTM
jgi:hypothetical protein